MLPRQLTTFLFAMFLLPAWDSEISTFKPFKDLTFISLMRKQGLKQWACPQSEPGLLIIFWGNFPSHAFSFPQATISRKVLSLGMPFLLELAPPHDFLDT